MARACARTFAAAITLMAVEGAIAQTGSVLSLRRSSRTLPATGDPVWQLQLTVPGQKTHSFEAVVGRASRQQADRHRLGSQAPLPAGSYRLTDISEIRPEDPVELGRVLWIGLEPQFPTARRALGIHHDPSAGMGPESGTDGCIGLIRGSDLLSLAALLEQSGTHDLVVIQ
ncbi:L,D-transpeptidase family protein [Synechococcus sp. EJ6-Ellesmere]|uniref:L,D-transpeptidase family protein n=1 Tax=Synechococcus sp. EJ6-Ellesmere TaxID=2823734 RepID=UPI0020CD1709|nr:L,D-transpeptidase family protein [Synechococcus sp. EJ6-Ellesmere]